LTALQDSLGIAVCGRLWAAAGGVVSELGIDDVRLLHIGGDCAALDAQSLSQGLRSSTDNPTADSGRDGLVAIRVLGGECIAGGVPADCGGVACAGARLCPGAAAAASPEWPGRFRLLMEKLVLEWRLEFQRARLNSILANAYRRITDFTMVQEFVSGAAESLAEDKVVERMFDLFAGLASPTAMVFVSLNEGRPERAWSRPAGLANDEVKGRLAAFRRSYEWSSSGRGFQLSLRHRSKSLGVLEVEGFALGDLREHYLDLGLVVAKVCALAISNARLYRDLKGPNRSYLEFAEDLQDALSARKRAEEKQAQLLKQVESANQELNDFAYVVSHDLKAPLRAIDSLTRWLADDYRDKFDVDGRAQLELLLGRVKRMHDLIDGILQYSRAGRVREERAPVDLAELVPEVIDRLAPPAHFTVTIVSPLPVISAERTRVGQVFQNLLSNAIKYMDKPEGLAEVGCAEEPAAEPGGQGMWRFFVKDNGPGIEEKDFERAFQLFQTLKPRDATDSTGVGLSVVKKIVEMYGGRVWVESKVGEGSTFLFTLPKAQEAGHGARSAG
jgi:signal transduction histidine kinase